MPARPATPTAYLMLDWNGTVVDDLPRAYGATQTALQKVTGKVAIGALDQFRASFRLPLATFFAALGVPSAQTGEAVEVWNDEMASRATALAPGAHALLTRACELNVHTHIISGARQDAVHADARALGIEALLTSVSGSVHPKRDAIRLLHQTAAPLIYVGDTEYDMREAAAADAITVGTTYGYRPSERLRQAGARLIIDDLAKVIPVLETEMTTLAATTSSRSAGNQVRT